MRRLDLLGPCAIAVLLAATAIRAQTTYIVQGGGAALQSAIQAAAPGDVLDVQAGSYSPVVCSLGLEILLRPGVEVGSASPSSPIGIEFHSVPVGETAIVTGGVVSGISAHDCGGTVIVDRCTFQHRFVPMQFANCSGAVVFQDSVGFSASTVANGQIEISNCDQVSFTSCVVPHSRVTNSVVSYSDSVIRPEGPYTDGLHLVSGSVVIQGGIINGSYMFSFPIPTVAIVIDGGQLVATGGTIIRRQSFVPPTENAILANGGTLVLDPSVTVAGTPPIVGPGIVIHTPTPTVAVSHTPTTLHATVGAEPGSAVFTFAGLQVSPQPTPWGEAWLLPSDPILDLSILPASGSSSFMNTFASVPPFTVLTLQSVALSTGGVLRVGAPVRFAWN